MKKRLLYIVALILTGIASSAFVYGQSTVLERLQSKTWRWATSNYKFTCCEQIAMRDYGRTISHPFYLSDTPTHADFDDSKVGNVPNGRYIIRPGFADDTEFPVFANEIISLNDTELKLRLRDGITIATFRALEAHTMQYVLRNTPTSTLPFAVKKNTGFLEGYGNFPINQAIVDRIHTNVQLTQFTNNAAQRRGAFLRKFQSGSNFIVVVTFGDLYRNRTDVICIVNSAGTILSTLEGLVIVDGMTVKSYTITPSGQVHIYQVVPSSTTPLRFQDVTSFPGNLTNTIHSISGSSFSSGTFVNSVPKTFTRSLLSDPDREVQMY